MARRHPCDVCGHERQRWQRLCPVCWSSLPHDIRRRVSAMYRIDKKAWRQAKREAIAHLGARVQAHMAAYRRIAAQLGERDA